MRCNHIIIILSCIFYTILLTGVILASPHALRDGVNHRLGDDSFIAHYGRTPTHLDREEVRLRVHLEYVRQWLGSRPASHPSLKAQRSLMLGYLDDYIAKGTTPHNNYVSHRTPVFIDAHGHICAVGYLIERSVGRAFAEQIATHHRLDYLEDISAKEPKVQSWIASSGFTLEELASIQPGYTGDPVIYFKGWITDQDLREHQAREEDTNVASSKDAYYKHFMEVPMGVQQPPDGPYHDQRGFSGHFEQGEMAGRWRHVELGKEIGSGVFEKGTGVWKSTRADGTLLATGHFHSSHAEGAWLFFHPSGHLAALGSMSKGQRHGEWKFFYDAPEAPILAIGEFHHGVTLGRWEYYAKDGSLVMRVFDPVQNHSPWGYVMAEVQPRNSVQHHLYHHLGIEYFNLHKLSLGDERLYVTLVQDPNNVEHELVLNQQGQRIHNTGHQWRARMCKWPAQFLKALRDDNLERIAEYISSDSSKNLIFDLKLCGDVIKPIKNKRIQHYEQILASFTTQYTPRYSFDINPSVVTSNQNGTLKSVNDTQPNPTQLKSLWREYPQDMVTQLTDHLAWFIEYSDVDQAFMHVYLSLPGYTNLSTDD